MRTTEENRTKETFIIEVLSNENATWQGQVIWADRKRKQYFRSALELLRLMDSAIDSGDDDAFEEEAEGI